MSGRYSLRVLTAKEVDADDILQPLVIMINEAYKHFDDGEDLPRYSDARDLATELGEHGLCAVIQDSCKEDLPIAVAAAKPWQPKDGRIGSGQLEPEGYQWEIGPAASRSDQEYRQKGFVEQCVSALQKRLLEMTGRKAIRLWITAAQEISRNVLYWQRRGFERVGDTRTVPIGQWHRSKSYTLVDMKKDVDRGT